MSFSAALRQPSRVGLIVFVMTAAVLSAWIGVRFGFNNPPSSTGDELSYDSMAWELSRGRGFSVNVHDAEFRRPYHDASVTEPELYALPSIPAGPIAFRPPLFSTIFAATNVVAGRQFYLIRTFNVLCMAATAGLLAAFLFRETSPLPAALTTLLLLVDVRTRLYARSILTEPLACLLFAGLCLVLLNSQRTKRFTRTHVVAISLLTGLSILTRSVVVLWLPGLFVLILWLLFRSGRRAFAAAKTATMVILLTVVVLLPWSVRNIRLLERFSPMGTQGQMELFAGYSDTAWQEGGVWQNLAARGIYDDVVTADMTPIEREVAVAAESTRKAMEWIRRHPLRLPALAAMKIISELTPNSTVEWVVLALAVVALFRREKRETIWLIAALIGINLTAVGATWSVQGRFLVPQLFAFYALAGFGVDGILQKFSVRLSHVAPTGRSETAG